MNMKKIIILVGMFVLSLSLFNNVQAELELDFYEYKAESGDYEAGSAYWVELSYDELADFNFKSGDNEYIVSEKGSGDILKTIDIEASDEPENTTDPLVYLFQSTLINKYSEADGSTPRWYPSILVQCDDYNLGSETVIRPYFVYESIEVDEESFGFMVKFEDYNGIEKIPVVASVQYGLYDNKTGDFIGIGEKLTIRNSEMTEDADNSEYGIPIRVDSKNICIIEYEELPVKFCIPMIDGKAGTYLVKNDTQKRQLQFKWISDSKDVPYINNNKNREEPERPQTGTNPINLVRFGKTELIKPKYIILEHSNQSSYAPKPEEDALENGFNLATPSILASYEQHEAAYVFVEVFQHDLIRGARMPVYYSFYGDEIIKQVENAGWLERWLTRALTFLGDVFMALIKWFLGTDLTIDKIIFNDYNVGGVYPTVVDMQGGRGYFGNSAVSKAINLIYSMFTILAISVYVALLLIIGIRILLDSGSKNQSKYTQNITNWIIGLVMLFITPYFIKYIPTISNAIVEHIGKERTVMYTYYNIESVDFSKIEDSELLGEDPRTSEIDKLINAKTEEQIAHALGNYSISMQELNKQIMSILPTLEKYKNADGYVLSQAVSGNSQQIFTNLMKFETTTDPETIDLKLVCAGTDILDSLDNVTLVSALRKFCGDFFTNENLQEQITELKSIKNAPDLMGKMRLLAGQTGRFIYAVVWLVCIYEMIVVLCMYYKRIFVVALLLAIYPLVAITYVIDKFGDGAAQSLTTWYKEFTVNILVQIAHAIVYVVLVETGIKIYIANNNNWLFFLLSVLFIFPAERILRGIFGLTGSTIGNLKANPVGLVGGAVAIGSVAKGTARAANRKIGITKKGKEEKEKAKKQKEKEKKKREEKDKKLQERAKEKERLRRRNRAFRMHNSNNVGALKKGAYKIANAASKARSQMYKVGNSYRKLKANYRKFQNSKFAKFAKGTWKVARKGAGIAYGATSAITSAGDSGLGAGLVSGIAEGRIVGGFKEYKKLNKGIRDERINKRGATSGGASNSGQGSVAANARTANAIRNRLSGGTASSNGGHGAGTGSGATGASGSTVNTTNTTNINIQDE